ncbi:UNVERIFIED_CONTAM: hypothetical protein FKN15_052615 [Acipenser sinensis]
MKEESEDPERPGAHVISTDDTEYPREFRTLGSGGAVRRFSSAGLVHTSERRHTVIAAQSLEALSGLPKRDAFLDHLKNKYPPHHSPHHSLPSLPHQGSPQHTQHSPAGGMRGQQDRVREQTSRETGVLFLQYGDETRRVHLTHELSSADTLHALIAHMFPQKLTTGMLKSANMAILIKDEARNVFYQLEDVRQRTVSLLIRERVLFLQYGDETRRVHLTHELSSADMLHALIAHMFPQKLTTGMLKSANMAILIKDEARNVFYQLEDVRDIQDRSVIKIFRKEPLYASYPGSHLANGDLRVNEGIWKNHEDLSNQSPKLVDDFSKNSDFHMSSLSSWQSHSASRLGSQNSPAHSQSSQTVPIKSRVLDELGGRKTVDKSVSVEAAERDWEEKRASLTQYSAQDINRLLEETQAELMKAIPDLDFVAKQQKLSGGSASGNASPTPEHRPGKPQHPAQKLKTKTEHILRRGSEKPSKSPPPPPPRRSFPSSHGLTTTRSVEVILTSKSMKQSDSEETESLLKPQVKLRRSVSEAPQLASTPPIIASGVRDKDEEDRLIAELETGSGSSPTTRGLHSAASRLKHIQQSSPEKSKQRRTREECGRQQGQQQVFHF